jgi:hypothetical protein
MKSLRACTCRLSATLPCAGSRPGVHRLLVADGLEEVADDGTAVGREDGFRVELHALGRMGGMVQAHRYSAGTAGRDDQVRGSVPSATVSEGYRAAGRAARTRRYCHLCAPSPPGIVSGRSPIVSGVAPPRRQAARPGADRAGRAAVRQPRSGPSPADGMPPGTEAEPAVPFLAVVSGSRACRAISGTRPFAGRRAGSCSRCAIGRRATGPGIRCHGRAGSPGPRSWCG